MLNLGHSGAGKTGSLVSLVDDHTLVIADFDNGLDIVKKALLARPDAKEVMQRVYYEPFMDHFQAINGEILPKGIPSAWTNFVNKLTKWKYPDYNLGNVATWKPDTVLCIDSMTYMCRAALRYIRAINGHQSDKQVSQPDWGQAQEQVRRILDLLYDSQVNTNIVINAHIKVQTDAEGFEKGYPLSLGQALPPEIGTYFNCAVRTLVKGSGANLRRVINTRVDRMVDLKVPIMPDGIPEELPMETGMRDLFRALNSNK